MSLKDRIIADVATVFLNTDHFAESVTLIRTVGESVVTAVVEIDDPIAEEENPPDVEGNMKIATTDVEHMDLDGTPVLQARIRGELYHVFDHAADDFGMTRFSIRRKFTEARHSNLYDISDRQAQWVHNDT